MFQKGWVKHATTRSWNHEEKSSYEHRSANNVVVLVAAVVVVMVAVVVAAASAAGGVSTAMTDFLLWGCESRDYKCREIHTERNHAGCTN